MCVFLCKRPRVFGKIERQKRWMNNEFNKEENRRLKNESHIKFFIVLYQIWLSVLMFVPNDIFTIFLPQISSFRPILFTLTKDFVSNLNFISIEFSSLRLYTNRILKRIHANDYLMLFRYQQDWSRTGCAAYRRTDVIELLT